MGPRPAQERLRELQNDFRTAFLDQPTVTIDLAYGATKENDPFYARIVREFYDDARAPRRALPLIGNFTWGVALCRLPATFEEYFAMVDGSARRNYKKAERKGYTFARIDPNRYLEDLAAVRRSTDVRQGPMPDSILNAPIHPCTDPPSRTNVHDYAWFGVLQGEKVVAYASCMIAGELASIEAIYGHAAFQEDGVVPRLVLGIADYLYGHFPHVRYFAYDAYFGASETLRRFKRKLAFLPHHVHWVLDGHHLDAPRADGETPRELVLDVPSRMDFQMVYRLHRESPLHVDPITNASFHYLDNPVALALLHRSARTRFDPPGLLKAAAKLASGIRHYYAVTIGDRIVSDGWVTLGRCRYYAIEHDDVVIGPVWTDPEHRGKGLATFALANAVNALIERGKDVSYIDTSRDNVGMQKAIARVGYGRPVAAYPRHAEP